MWPVCLHSFENHGVHYNEERSTSDKRGQARTGGDQERERAAIERGVTTTAATERGRERAASKRGVTTVAIEIGVRTTGDDLES